MSWCTVRWRAWQVRYGEIAIPAFMRDCKHPSGEGHTIMAQLLVHRLLHAPPTAAAAATGDTVEAACGGGGAGASASALAAMVTAARASLPPPLLPGGQEQGSSVCARGPQLSAHVTARSGFELTDEGRGPQKLGCARTAPRRPAPQLPQHPPTRYAINPRQPQP